MKFVSIYSALAVTIAVITGLSLTTPNAKAEASSSQAPAPLVVAELFTSQSCSSCPPAEALFAELSDREGLLTLEWHVDYWDELVHGGSKWKDRYSDKVFTERQRSYNANLRGTRGVYTPQAIVNGHVEGVGNSRSKVSALVDNARALPLSVEIENNAVIIGANDTEVEVLFVRLLKQHETNVKGGENKGRKLHGKNIVLDADILGKTANVQTQFEIPSIGAGETCAILVQSLSKDVGPMLGAAKCG